MDYKKLYAEKLVSAEKAASVVKSGDWVDYGWTTGTPVAVDAAIAKRLPELENVNFRGGILMWVPEIFKIENPAAHMTWNSWHMSGIERKAIAQGFSFYAPIRYSELPRYYRESATKPDVAVFQVAPMDEHGYFNFGPNASHMAACCETSKVVIVEVNENMPVCLGGFENGIHISNVDMIVEGSNPTIAEMGGGAAATDVDEAVAKLIVDEIPDGACLQLGIGGMPNAVGSLIAKSDLKDLGVHTEMYVDAFVDIAAAGKITGAHKALDKGRQVYAFGAGTKKLYDYLNNNPACMSARLITPTTSAPSQPWTTSCPSTTRLTSTSSVRYMQSPQESSTSAVQADSLTSFWALTCPRAERASSAAPPPSRTRLASCSPVFSRP